MNKWYVYLIQTRLNTLYTGITTDPARRIRQHRGLIKGGAKALRGKSPLCYRFIFEVAEKRDAMQLEVWIKSQTHATKAGLGKRIEPLPFNAQPLANDVIQQMNARPRSQS